MKKKTLSNNGIIHVDMDMDVDVVDLYTVVPRVPLFKELGPPKTPKPLRQSQAKNYSTSSDQTSVPTSTHIISPACFTDLLKMTCR
jgi:hypothetical protein